MGRRQRGGDDRDDNEDKERQKTKSLMRCVGELLFVSSLLLRVRGKARKNQLGLRQELKRFVIIRNGYSDYLDLSQGEQFVSAMPTSESDRTIDARHVGFGSPQEEIQSKS